MKIKRLISLILVMIIMATSLTTNVFALEGCDGVLDTGEIELESYIEWNTFKSKIDGLNSKVLDEIRNAESRGILPEIFPVGDDQMVVKTDVGFYSFLLLDDGTYKSTSKPVRFAHWGGGKNATLYHTGTGTPTAGEIQNDDYDSWSWCCHIDSIIDYGYSHGNFFIYAAVGNDFDDYGNDVKHGDHALGNIISIYEHSDSKMLFVVKPNSSLGIQEAMHGYNDNWSTSDQAPVYVYTYWGEDKLYLLQNRYDSYRYDYWWVQEYDLKNAPIYTYPRDCLALYYNATGATVTSITGKLKELNDMTALTVNAPNTYPTASFNFIGWTEESYYGKDNREAKSVLTATYDKKDNGKRNVKPSAGFIDASIVNGRLHTFNYKNASTPNSNAIATQQVQELQDRIKDRCGKNGVPMYGHITVGFSTDYGENYHLNIGEARLSRTYNGKTYHDGKSKLYRRYTPRLGSDGNYILGQNTVHMIGAGNSKNATRLTFENLSLGSDAKIEIYGCPVGVSESSAYGTNTNLVLLDTITNAKNSQGTYTTPIFPYGYLKVEFTGGESTSGRGQGYVISNVESGRYGSASFEDTIERLDAVHCPNIYYGGSDVLKANIPSGAKTSSRTAVTLNSTTLPSRAYHKVLSNVYIPNGQRINIVNVSNSGNSYDAYYASVALQLHPVGSTTVTATLNTSTSNRTYVTSSATSGYYDVYAYNYYYSNNNYRFNLYWGEDVWDTVTSTSSSDFTYDVVDLDKIEQLDDFTKVTYTFQYSDLTTTPTGTSNTTLGKFNKTITLNPGDTYKIKVTSDYSNTASNSTLRFTSDGGTTMNLPSTASYQLLNPSYAGNPSYSGSSFTNYRNETMYLYNGATATYDIYLYDGYYNNATYKFNTNDKIELTVYRAKKVLDKTYNKTQIINMKGSSTGWVNYYLLSQSNTSTYATTTGVPVYGMLHSYKIVPDTSQKQTYHQLYYGNGSNSVYFYNTYDTSAIITQEPYVYQYGNASYAQYLGDNTMFYTKIYDTAYRYIYYRYYTAQSSTSYPTYWEEAVNYTLTPTAKSGYKPSTSLVTINFPKTSNYVYYRVLVDDVEVKSQFYVNSSTNYTQSFYVKYADGADSANIKILTHSYSYSNASQYDYQDLKLSMSATNYYYDTAGTRINRYTVNGTKTWNYTISTQDGHFSRLKLTNINIPSPFTVTIDGTAVTGTSKDFGWKNKSSYAVVVSVTGDGTHGNFKIPEMDKLFNYTLETKKLSDATSYSASKTGLTEATLSTTWTATKNSNKEITGYTATTNHGSYTISGTDNAYVKLVSNVSSQNQRHDYSSSYTTSVTINASNLGSKTATSFWNSDWRGVFERKITDWAWLPSSGSSITVTSTTTNASFKDGSWYQINPTGSAVTAYYVIKHTNIPDTTIKTYNNGYDSGIYAGHNYIGSEVFDKYPDADEFSIYAGVGLTANNGYSTTHSYYTSCTFGSAQFEDASGNSLLALTNGTKRYKIPENTAKIVFNPTSTYYQYNANSSGAKGTTVSYGNTGSLAYDSSSGYCKYKAVAAMRIAEVITYAKNISNIEMAANEYYPNIIVNNVDGFEDTFIFDMNDMAGNDTFEDGRFGTPKIQLETYSGSTAMNKLQRIDVIRKYTDGTVANLATIPVAGTLTWFRQYDWQDDGKTDDAPCNIYHIGNDLMYVAYSDMNPGTSGNDGKSYAWLRTGHWHLKGSADEIEGITQGGINNPVKTMETDDADTEIVVNELDMNAKSWQMGHNIKDGKVTDQKLSDDVKKELREINLGTVTFIKGDGEQYKYVPVGTYGVDADTLDGTRLKYGTRYVDIYAYDDNQVEIEILTSMIGNKNINGTTSGSLSAGEHIFTGNVTVGGVSVPVVLQVNVINRPTTSGKTTITLTD